MRFYTVPEVAEATGYSPQTVRNWIGAGELKAVQSRQRGAFKIPEWALRERQERLGIVEMPVVEMMPDAPTEVVDPMVFLARRITPALRRLGVTSISELVAMAEVDPDLYETEWSLLQDVGAYLRVRAGSVASVG